MDASDSDDETVEFEIEVVSSSSSVSLASDSIVELEVVQENRVEVAVEPSGRISPEEPIAIDENCIEPEKQQVGVATTETDQADGPGDRNEDLSQRQDLSKDERLEAGLLVVIPGSTEKADEPPQETDHQLEATENPEDPQLDEPIENQNNDLNYEESQVGTVDDAFVTSLEAAEEPVEAAECPKVEPLEYTLIEETFRAEVPSQAEELVENPAPSISDELTKIQLEDAADSQLQEIFFETNAEFEPADEQAEVVVDSGVSVDLESDSNQEKEHDEIQQVDVQIEQGGDANLGLPEISVVEVATPAHPTTLTIQSGADLEREFDEEPEFEARHVELKRNCDVKEEYFLGEELGRGRFGTVYRCTEQASGRDLAAKFVNLRRREDREDVEREIHIMSQLQHKRLLQLYDAFDDGKNQMCLITELVEGGELFERIIDDDFELTEKKAAIFMRQICEGVDYMHAQRIVHLDMKPENILCLSKTGNRIKLIDFGLARQLNSKEPLRVMFGTPDFAAPEVLAYDTVTLATDMWSVGVICYVLLSGLSPFMGDNDLETMANVLRATYDFDDDSFEPISDLAKDFIAKLLVKEPSERLKPAECLKHLWLQRGGVQLEASILERRKSSAATLLNGMDTGRLAAMAAAAAASEATGRVDADFEDAEEELPGSMSLSKRNLKKYVVRRKWHKTVHAIMALGRMGANLKMKFGGGGLPTTGGGGGQDLREESGAKVSESTSKQS